MNIFFTYPRATFRQLGNIYPCKKMSGPACHVVTSAQIPGCGKKNVFTRDSEIDTRYIHHTAKRQHVYTSMFTKPNQKLCVIIQQWQLDVHNLPCINTETLTPPVRASCYRLFSSGCREKIHCMHSLPLFRLQTS